MKAFTLEEKLNFLRNLDANGNPRPSRKVNTDPSKAPRLIKHIAQDIEASWKSPNPRARPYISAMLHLLDINDSFLADDAESIIHYFLANAVEWKGDDARRLKAELRKIAKG